MQVKIAIVGAGYVSDMYVSTLDNHPHLQLAGVYDKDVGRAQHHSERWNVPRFESLQQLLQDDSIPLILNLTNPRSHFEVTKACLEAGKHVYSEKPLGMTLEEGRALVDLAKEKNLLLGSAPCSWMSESLATIKKGIDDGLIGKVRLVYANFDDGLIAPKMDPWNWKNAAGIPWPAKDEFEVGCTYEHAGYVLTWLVHLFGAAKSVTSFASCQLPDKGIEVEHMAPDFTVGCLTFDETIVARVTCGLVAPRDKSFVVVGDDGIIYTDSVRSDIGPVYHQAIPTPGRWGGMERRVNRMREFLERHLPQILWSGRPWQFRRKLPLVGTRPKQLVSRGKPVDFLRGAAEMAASIRETRECRISADFGLHLLELTQHLQHPQTRPASLTIQSDSRVATYIQ